MKRKFLGLKAGLVLASTARMSRQLAVFSEAARRSARLNPVATCLLAPLTLLAAISLPAAAVVGASGEATEMLVFVNAGVVDGASDVALRDATVVVDGRMIREISPAALPIPAGARVVDLRGRYILPGLIDAHVHIADADAARRALMSGVTTARSMGVNHFADVGLAALAAAGAIQAPELLAAGYHVLPRPSDALFLDMPEFADLMVTGVRGPDAMRRLGKALTERGVRWIKVNATARAGLPSADPREQFYQADELRALVDQAGKAGIPVAAHAHGEEGGRAAVEAGVRSIEHGTYLSETTLALMADRHVYLVPTIAIVAQMASPPAGGGDASLRMRGQQMLPRIRETATSAQRLGVMMVAGTDSDYRAGNPLSIGHELEEFAAAGFAPADVIRSATSLAARLLGIETRTGTLAPGMEADLLIVEKNPLEEIATVRNPLMIVHDGAIVLDKIGPAARVVSRGR